MNFDAFDEVILFGGAGYIGSHIINYLVSNYREINIIIADISEPRKECYTGKTIKYYDDQISYIKCDVRKKINIDISGENCCVINLAAIHREPGHEPPEYFETNILGAENINHFCINKNIRNLIFTSSIAPYGHSDKERDEESQVVPYSPYGSSKLTAEKIHSTWQNESNSRSLIIVRPGVIYGPHEDGNVPRLIKAVIKGYFFYCGNKETRKAGGYVKELVNSIFFVANSMKLEGKSYILYNFSFSPPPTVYEYVSVIKKIKNIDRPTLSLPYNLVFFSAYLVNKLFNVIGKNSPIHPLRIKKLTINNTIKPGELEKLGYKFKFDLESAFNDWKKDSPKDWFE